MLSYPMPCRRCILFAFAAIIGANAPVLNEAAAQNITEIIDATDDDGVANEFDACPDTPVGLPVDCQGRPRLDLNDDCLVNGTDIAAIVAELLGN